MSCKAKVIQVSGNVGLLDWWAWGSGWLQEHFVKLELILAV